MSQEDLLPIDIHVDKLIEWLVNRNKAKLSWSKDLQPIRADIEKAQAELPMHIKTKLNLESQSANYFQCVEILKLLEEEQKQTGGKIKTLFGNYTSDQLQQWSNIIKRYENDCIFLAEGGRTLTQNVNFEIPNMKRTANSTEKQASDMLRKISDCKQSAKTYRKAYETTCEDMGIKGHDLRAELKHSVRELPKLLHAVEEAASTDKVKEAVELYTAFVGYHLDDADEEAAARLSTLKSIQESFTPMKFAEDTDLVLVGSDLEMEETSSGINWDISIEEAGAGDDSGAATIDWDMSVETTDAGEAATTDENDGTISIDWDIVDETESAETEAPTINLDLDLDASPEEDESKGEDKDGSTLADTSSRQAFKTDLLELEAFLDQRQLESTQSSGVAPPVAQQDVPFVMQKQNTESLEGLLEAVRNVLQQLKTQRIQRLLLLKTSSRYVDRVAESLKQKLASAKKLTDLAASLEQRQAELLQTAARTKKKVQDTIKATKTLKRQMEKSISKQYNGRVVNLFGDINNI